MGGAQVTANTININTVYANESNTDNGSDAAYGIQVGTGITGDDKKNNETTQIEVKDAHITLTNTVDSTKEGQKTMWGIPILGDLQPYQLSALRVIRADDNVGSNAIFKSTGTFTAHVFDSSKNGSGDYITGIYVSGDQNKVSLNDSQITLGKSGQYSSALKIGKGRTTGIGGGEIESYGNMVLDSTAESKAPTVRLVGTGSKLLAGFENSSSTIKSASQAILFGTNDYGSSYASTEQIVQLKNSNISTTSETASLILVNAGVTGAELSVDGEKSQLSASNKGWLIEVENPKKWENKKASLNFNLSNGAQAKGLMYVSGDSTLDVNISNNAVWQLQANENLTEQRATVSSLTLTDGGTLDARSFTTKDNAQYVIQVPTLINNSGVIRLDNSSYNDTLTIAGNYAASGQAQIKMNTLWNAPGDDLGTNSESDRLIIQGTATGQTQVIPVGINGTEHIIDGNVEQVATAIHTVPVIYVEKTGEQAFVGTARTSGISEVQLAKRFNELTQQDEYYWTAKAKDSKVDIYNPETSAYVQMPRANLELGYSSLGSLNERRGDYLSFNTDKLKQNTTQPNGQTWSRVVVNHLNQSGKNRFNSTEDQYLLQAGHDFIVDENPDSKLNQYIGAYLTYGHNQIDFEDRYRTVNGEISSNKHTGKGTTDAVSLGAYHTIYHETGSYLDLVGQASYLHNVYKTGHLKNTSQNGWGALVSAEVGKPYYFNVNQDSQSEWLIEPQAQLSYQYLGLDDFHDGIRSIDQNNQHGLRGRVGVRMAYNQQNTALQTNTFYVTANVLHDFVDPSAVDIGADHLKETYSTTWGTIGLGVQRPIYKNTALFADGRYEHSLNSTKREAYKGTIGINFKW